ncbi:hypothetical protein ACFWIP_13895, partial [Streptomyces anulatus]
MENEPVVQVKGLVKRYGTKTAVNGLDLVVATGAVTARRRAHTRRPTPPRASPPADTPPPARPARG